jgi:hypothetical protein
MSQELKLGKYEFYPYEKQIPKDTRSIEELLDYLRAKRPERDVRRLLRRGKFAPRRRRRGHR